MSVVTVMHTFGIMRQTYRLDPYYGFKLRSHFPAVVLLCFQVSSLASTLPPLIERVSELESRLTRSLTIAKQGLDILADQLVALGALNGRSSPNKKNPLAGTCADVLCDNNGLWPLAFILVGNATPAVSVVSRCNSSLQWEWQIRESWAFQGAACTSDFLIVLIALDAGQ
jgi:hypothetical protein